MEGEGRRKGREKVKEEHGGEHEGTGRWMWGKNKEGVDRVLWHGEGTREQWGGLELGVACKI